MELLPSEVSYSGRQETEAWRLRSSQQRERLPCCYPPFHLVSAMGEGMALSHALSNLRRAARSSGRGWDGGVEPKRSAHRSKRSWDGGLDPRRAAGDLDAGGCWRRLETSTGGSPDAAGMTVWRRG